MSVRSMVLRAILAGAVFTSLAGQVSAQTPAPRVGALAKALLADARSEAKKWRADAHLFQLTARRVTDGVALMWYYDFFAPGAPGAKCLRVNFGKNKQAFTQQIECKAEPEIKDFAVDSDKAVAIAREQGLKHPELTMVLMSVPTRAGQRVVWTIMEGNGMKEGDLTIDIDSQTGELRGKRKM